MKTESEKTFKAVDYMRKVREELSALSQKDKKQFRKELDGARKAFLATRKQSRPNNNEGLCKAS